MTGYIYAIRAAGFVKLGWSKNPKNRVRYLKTAMPLDCELIGMRPGTRYDEGLLHRALRAHCHRREWFRCEGAVLDFLATLTPVNDPDRGDGRRGPRSPETIAKVVAAVRSAAKRRHAEYLAACERGRAAKVAA